MEDLKFKKYVSETFRKEFFLKGRTFFSRNDGVQEEISLIEEERPYTRLVKTF